MTRQVTVNPKKLRPYDEPPKRRRSLIPGGPDTAATGFLVAAALWLAVATVIGLLAVALRIIPFEFSFPLLFGLEFSFTERRVDAGFINATVYGWLTNAGFAAIAFMTPRLLGKPLAGEKLLNFALVIWNMTLAAGMASLYVFQLGPHAPLTSMSWLLTGGLATAALIITGAFVMSAGTALRTSYISLWFAGVALLSLLGLLGLNAGLGLLAFVLDLPDLTTALASVFIGQALMALWLLGMAYATLYYVVPRSVGQPLASGGLALLAWLTWLALAPASALSVLTDASVPFVVTSLGAVAAMLLLVPAALTVVNLALTMQNRWSLLFGTGATAFAAVSLAFLLAVSLLQAIGSLRAVHVAVAGTEWETGVFVWATYGAFSLAAFALAEHALPRILRRTWGGGLLSSAQLWLTFGGATIAGLALMGAGMAESSLLSQGVTADAVGGGVILYRIVAFLGFALVALAGLAMLVNLFLLYTSGRPTEYTVPDASAPAAAGH
jgi:cytochrome c oxidase cbb3-type subunit 1